MACVACGLVFFVWWRALLRVVWCCAMLLVCGLLYVVRWVVSVVCRGVVAVCVCGVLWFGGLLLVGGDGRLSFVARWLLVAAGCGVVVDVICFVFRVSPLRLCVVRCASCVVSCLLLLVGV